MSLLVCYFLVTIEAIVIAFFKARAYSFCLQLYVTARNKFTHN